jgi:hypothetical protein
MSSEEKRAGISLAAVFALRMLGLFLILPVFSVYAKDLPSGNDMALVGIALGAYGLTQACLQIAYGAASDRFGRKPVIVFGLLLFVAGSFVAACADDIYVVIAGRVLQGAGAISAAVTALAADLTREQHLTKVMAMIGSSIGLVFAVSMVGAPLLYVGIGMPGIFALTGVLAMLAIFVVLRVVPAAPAVPRQPAWQSFVEVLSHRQLLRLNFGVFALHLMLTAMWVLLPSELISTGALPVAEHWKGLPARPVAVLRHHAAGDCCRRAVWPHEADFQCRNRSPACRPGRFRPVCARPLWPGVLADAVLRCLQHSRSDAAFADFAYGTATCQRRSPRGVQHNPGTGTVSRWRHRWRSDQICRCRSGLGWRCSPDAALAGARTDDGHAASAQAARGRIGSMISLFFSRTPWRGAAWLRSIK